MVSVYNLTSQLFLSKTMRAHIKFKANMCFLDRNTCSRLWCVTTPTTKFPSIRPDGLSHNTNLTLARYFPRPFITRARALYFA
jgi:hypothetical protein